MHGCKKNTVMKAAAAGAVAALTVGAVSCCTASGRHSKGAKIKKGAKKALKTAERYIDSIM